MIHIYAALDVILTPLRIVCQYLFTFIFDRILLPALQFLIAGGAGNLSRSLPMWILLLVTLGTALDFILHLRKFRGRPVGRSRSDDGLGAFDQGVKPLKRSARKAAHDARSGNAAFDPARGNRLPSPNAKIKLLSDIKEKVTQPIPYFLGFTPNAKRRIYGSRRRLKAMRRRLKEGSPPNPRVPTRSIAYRYKDAPATGQGGISHPEN